METQIAINILIGAIVGIIGWFSKQLWDSCQFLKENIHNLEIEDCLKAIKEIQRVSNGNAFIQVDAYRNDKELMVFKDWMLTAKTYLKPEEWLEVFKKANYTGYYYWTILEFDEWIL